MCGRFTQTFSWQEVHDLLTLEGPPLELAPRYNVAPGQNIAAVRLEPDGRRLAMLRWGLIPGWAGDPAIAYRLINARAETAALKPSFRAAFRSRRCLIPTNGFYEWQRAGAVRQPYLIGRGDRRLLAFAGLWEHWTVPRGADPERFACRAPAGRRHRDVHDTDHRRQRGSGAGARPHAGHPGRGSVRGVAARRAAAARSVC